MQAVRFIGKKGPAEYVTVLADPASAVIDSLLPDPNVRIRFTINERPLHVAPDKSVRDFLDLAALTYVLDELEERELADDYWSRRFRVMFPVAEPDVWMTSNDALVRALATLTGDRFEFVWPVRGALPSLGRHRYGLPRDFDAVCLFSGGIDSLCGAYALLSEGKKVILVGHQADGATSAAQKRLYRHLQRRFPRAVYFVQCRVARTESSDQRYALPSKVEDTHRPRSLLFMALAVTVARSARIERIYMPENGLIALNPPLQMSRLGSLTTRTAHPQFLIQLLEFMRASGLYTGSLTNPFLFQSKTDMLREVDAALKPMLLESNSCARPSRYRNHGVEHCGYCMPCIYRRVALMEAGLDRAADYAFDVFGKLSRLTPKKQADFRALVSFSSRVCKASPTALDLLVLAHGTFSPIEASTLGPSPASDLSPWSDMLLRWAQDFLDKVDTSASGATKKIVTVRSGARVKR